MRRLVVEWSINEAIKKIKEKTVENLKKSGADDNSESVKKAQIDELKNLELLKKIKTFEMLHILRSDSFETAAIIRIELNEESSSAEELLKALIENVKIDYQLLEQEKGVYTYFIKGQPIQPSPEAANKRRMYPVLPFEIRDGKIKAAYIGENDQVKEFLENASVHYKVLSLTDAKFSLESPVNCLTEKQQEAIALAFRLGYFDTPRKVSVDELAGKLGLASSTLAVHLRRAERRLLAAALNE